MDSDSSPATPVSLSSVRLLKGIHRDVDVFSSRHHARYFEDETVYHVVSRVLCGFALLVPRDDINDMVAGVLGHVQAKNPNIELFAYAFLSNHFHLALRGPGIPEFVGQLKQQISLRLKHYVEETFETMWSGRYAATALITGADQARCFEYILSQGVKEGLVERPEQWPGVHCAKQIFFEEPCRGRWLNATTYGEAKRREARKQKAHQQNVAKSDHTEDVVVQLARLPVYDGLDNSEYRCAMRALRERIIEKGRALREGKPALGVKRVRSVPRDTVFHMPRPPWFEERKRMIVWSNPALPETRAYLERYHSSQIEFAIASHRYRSGERNVPFPPGMYLPPVSPRAAFHHRAA